MTELLKHKYNYLSPNSAVTVRKGVPTFSRKAKQQIFLVCHTAQAVYC